ncbi:MULTISPECIES: hypothetical protein [Nonlabens]|uniref:YgdI/YgdR family lipoprotein n=1 Tax=Nonlabens agnitus TaxID=870484 RepID=A0A2S9WVA7_9FLAO|nr:MULTISPECIES: hypothetical protein [Nonlabens]KQC32003.1 hypothetical protein AAU57_00705 [Nonlabens sp. YIK11]PRP67393.1 hypothetical protein BST86_09960 [Nonlabens agnitus]
MKTLLKVTFIAAAMVVSFASCRENEEMTTEETAQEMIDNGDNVEVKEDKVKIENNDGSETKIKYDDNGNVEKIKTDDNS